MNYLINDLPLGRIGKPKNITKSVFWVMKFFCNCCQNNREISLMLEKIKLFEAMMISDGIALCSGSLETTGI